jgi:hypothetical protein
MGSSWDCCSGEPLRLTLGDALERHSAKSWAELRDQSWEKQLGEC